MHSLGLEITNGPMNVTVCSGTKAKIPCGFTGLYNAFYTKPNWRIIKINHDGDVSSNKTVNWMNIAYDNNDGLEWYIRTSGSSYNAVDSFLSVGPVDETYNNTSYQCIFTINGNIIESTVGTITVIGRCITTYITDSVT